GRPGSDPVVVLTQVVVEKCLHDLALIGPQSRDRIGRGVHVQHLAVASAACGNARAEVRVTAVVIIEEQRVSHGGSCLRAENARPLTRGSGAPTDGSWTPS